MSISQNPQDWIYFAQGAANVIFKLVRGHDLNDGLTTNLEDDQFCLLRLRKQIKDLPTTVENWRFIESSVMPLTNEFMVPMKLVSIKTETLVALNAKAGRSEGDDYPPFELNTLESHGILMQNLKPPHTLAVNKNKYLHISASPWGPSRFAFIEFKPKWLVQSRSAPNNARYCRTCAVKQMRGKSHQITYCPLQLTNRDSKNAKKLVGRLIGNSLDEPWQPLIENCLNKIIMESPVFSMIKSVQERCKKSILDYNDKEELDDEFGLFMSACDCTLIINITTESKPIEKGTLMVQENGTAYFISCKLVDIDKKNISSPIKRQHWISIEKRLVDEGWYTGENPNSANQVPSCF